MKIKGSEIKTWRFGDMSPLSNVSCQFSNVIKRKESVKNIRMKRDGKQKNGQNWQKKNTEECAELNKRFRWNGASLRRGIRDFKWNFSTFKNGLKEKLYWEHQQGVERPRKHHRLAGNFLVYVYQFLTNSNLKTIFP